MQLIEQYNGTSALQEDEDGNRWWLRDRSPHPPAHWDRAKAAGAVGVIMEDFDEPVCQAWTAAEWEADTHRQNGHWLDNYPTYEELSGIVVPVAPESFVHLHTHSEYSALDGLSTVNEIVAEVKRLGQDSVAVTDHGTCAAHPAFYKACQDAGIKPILGIEAYLVHDRLHRPEKGNKDDQQATRKYYHLVLYAKNDIGLRNLWAMSTESYRDGFYGKPRMDWETLRRHSEGIIASTACLAGPVCRPFLAGDSQLALENLSKLVDIFGSDLYLEIMPNDMADQISSNEFLKGLGEDLGIPLLATVDSHYPLKEDHRKHQAWIAVQTQSDVDGDKGIFDDDLGLYLQSEQEVRDGLAYLGDKAVDEAIQSTRQIADACSVSISADPEPPIYLGSVQEDNDRVLEVCRDRWSKLRADGISDAAYEERFQYEFQLLGRKRFLGYYLMVSEYCVWAKSHGMLVGPGRGSGAASIIAYLLDITEVDPLEADLPFERFMTEDRADFPDFDVDFPASKKADILGHLRDRYGDDFVISIGTHLRLKSKGIVRDLGRAFRSALLDEVPESDRESKNAEIDADLNAVSKLIEGAEAGTAGLGMPWDELWDIYGADLNPYRDKYPLIFDTADTLVGRLKSYGKHAAGVCISTNKRLTDWLPLRRGEDESEQMISQFDMGALAALGLIKFDILTIRTLDGVQGTIDLIKANHGVDINVYEWKDEYKDPMIWETLADVRTLGVFQFETHPGTALTAKMKPTSVLELCDMGALVRPGPARSGLTDTYLRRRDGLEVVDYPDSRLEESLGDSYGCIVYQEQIMKTVSLLGGYSLAEADGIRKILGKKKVEQIGPAGQEFVTRAVEWGGMKLDDASALWDQMAEFSRYSFGKAHSYSYAMLSAWTLWLKTHYPVEFLTATLSTVDKDRVPEFIKEARKLGIEVLPPDINKSGRGFKTGDLSIRYGLDAIKGVGEKAVDAVVEGQPYTHFEDYLARKGSAANTGVTMLLAKVGAFDSIVGSRSGLVARLEGEKSGVSTQCAFKDESRSDGPEHLSFCTFDWSSEPRPVNKRTLKLLAPKPLPKKCTKACRSYTAPEPLDISLVVPYTPDQIMEIETELLGLTLSHSSFDKLDPGDRQTLLAEAEEITTGPTRNYTLAAVVTSIRKTKTRAMQEDMSILRLETEDATLTAAVFPRLWSDIERDVVKGRLYLVVVEKNDRGYALKALVNT